MSNEWYQLLVQKFIWIWFLSSKYPGVAWEILVQGFLCILCVSKSVLCTYHLGACLNLTILISIGQLVTSNFMEGRPNDTHVAALTFSLSLSQDFEGKSG